MNKPNVFLRWSLGFLAFTFTIIPLAAQLNVSVNRADAIYNVGETAYFQVTPTFSGTATYEIIYDNEAPVITSGSIDVNAGQTASIAYRHDEPGLVICRVNLNGIKVETAAAFAPLDISPLEEEPSDFDAFWANQRNLKNTLPLDANLTYHSESSYQTTYTFSLANIDNRRTYGYISIPKGAGPFPASITMPPYGASNAVVGADKESAEKGGMIAVSLSIHNTPVNQDDPNAYQPDVNTDKNQFYYRYALIGAMHVIDYLETRPDFDGNVCAMGVSQGGGLSILLAGIDDRVDLLIASNPTMGQHVGYKYDRASGFPYYLSIIHDKNQGNTTIFNEAVNATKYYDAMFHARRVKGAAYFLTGFRDMVVPSATALVSHNQIPGTKVLMVSKDGGHNHPNEYWNGRFEFMRRHIEGANKPPFQFGATNKGFFADAGDDQTVGTTANLSGQIFYDNDLLNNLSVSWKKVSGPGNVNFSNENAYNTTANFSANGTYVLQFVGRDERKMINEGKVYFISDAITITVTGGENPVYDLNIYCPSDQNVEIPNGQQQIQVTWDEPTASSNCTGGTSYFQLAGPDKGSALAEGTYTVTYRATDNCGNQEDCSFTLAVTKKQNNATKITVDCPNDIIVDAAPGDAAVTVSWVEPTARTSCNTGNNANGGDCSSTSKTGFSYMGTFDNSQFYLSNNDANWLDAKVAAEQAGGRLAVINDAAKNAFIQQNSNNQIVFIGLSDINEEGVPKWTDGSSLSYTNFVADPKNDASNHFITLYPWNGEWDWNNQFVAKKFILEIPCSGAGSTDNTVQIEQTAGGTNGSNFPIGTTTVSYSFADACGNTEACSFNVTVNAVPSVLTINCPTDIAVQIPAGEISTAVTWETATATSNCSSGASVAQISGNASGSQFTEGIYIITYQASDNCGNTETCSFSVNVSSTSTDLSINCPQNFVYQIPVGQSSVQANWDVPTATTTCPDEIAISQTEGPTNFSPLTAGVYTITYQAIDICGNTEACSFTVTVNPAPTSLTMTCPTAQVLEIPADKTTIVLDWTDPSISTDCDGNASLTQIGGSPRFNVVGAGTYTISYEAKDDCGNIETCSFVVTINQLKATNLTISCPSDQTLVLPQGQTEMAINWNDPTTSTDCSSSALLTQTGGVEKLSNVGEGSYPITYEAIDNCGNRTTCNFTITIERALVVESDISLTCPEDIILTIPTDQSSALVNWASPTASTTCVIDGNTCEGDFIEGYSYLGQFEESQYYKSNAPLSYPLAKIAVENMGGILTKISSAAENEFLRENIGTDLCIIGVNDEETEGVWQWTDGSTADYLNFPSNITNNESYDYGVINFWNGEWELTTNYIYKKYILEIPCTPKMESSSVQVNQTEGPESGSSFGIGTTVVTYEAIDGCGNRTSCSFNIIINQEDPVEEPEEVEGPPTAVVSTDNTIVADDFQVTITFNEPVTSLSGYDLDIENANWYNFTELNGTIFTVMLAPLNAGNVSIAVPADVAYDSDIQGNLASNTLNVTYEPDGLDNPTPDLTNNCLVQPVSVTVESGNTVGGSPSDLINSSTLTAENDLNAMHGGGNLYEGVWLNDGTDATLRFDLGEVQPIDGIAIWNYSYHAWLVLKRRGVKDFTVATSADGVNYTTSTAYTATFTTDRGEKETVQIFNFPTVEARYVRLQLLNALDDSFYVGLGEIRLTNGCIPTSASFRTTASTPPLIHLEKRTEKENLMAKVFPNPTNQTFYIQLDKLKAGKATIQVMNEVGVLVEERIWMRNQSEAIEIDLFGQADGLYFIKIVADEAQPILKKIIKTRWR